MAFAKIAKRNNKSTIEPTQSRHYRYNKRFAHDNGIPFPHQAATKSKYRKINVKHWFPAKCPYMKLPI